MPLPDVPVDRRIPGMQGVEPLDIHTRPTGLQRRVFSLSRAWLLGIRLAEPAAQEDA